MKPYLVRPKDFHPLKQRMKDPVPGRRLRVLEEGHHGPQDLLNLPGRRPGRSSSLRLLFFPVEPFHRRFPRCDIPVCFEALHRLLALAVDPGEREPVGLPLLLGLDGCLHLRDQGRVGGYIFEGLGRNRVVDGGFVSGRSTSRGTRCSGREFFSPMTRCGP
jgi:hypothetical protein